MNTLSICDIAAMTRAEAEAAMRARVQTVSVGDYMVLSRVLGHAKLFLDTRDIGFSCHVMLDGFWEIWLTLCLARMTRPGMGVIDVGANFGYYSLLMGMAVWPDGQLVSVEPNPPVFAAMSRSLRLNGLADHALAVQAAAGAQQGECHLYVPFTEPKNAALVPSDWHAAAGVVVPVPMVTVDQLTDSMRRVDIVKIDAEGAEMGIIQGMANTIRKFKPTIILEFNAARYDDPDTFLAYITSTYGLPSIIEFDGTMHLASEREILEENCLQDKLLVFGART